MNCDDRCLLSEIDDFIPACCKIGRSKRSGFHFPFENTLLRRLIQGRFSTTFDDFGVADAPIVRKNKPKFY